jgi:hypothetical protein
MFSVTVLAGFTRRRNFSGFCGWASGHANRWRTARQRSGDKCVERFVRTRKRLENAANLDSSDSRQKRVAGGFLTVAFAIVCAETGTLINKANREKELCVAVLRASVREWSRDSLL